MSDYNTANNVDNACSALLFAICEGRGATVVLGNVMQTHALALTQT
jgi:hypothetical protein